MTGDGIKLLLSEAGPILIWAADGFLDSAEYGSPLSKGGGIWQWGLPLATEVYLKKAENE